MSVAQLQASMDSAEITEWRAYFSLLNEERRNVGKPNMPESFKGLVAGMPRKKRKP